MLDNMAPKGKKGKGDKKGKADAPDKGQALGEGGEMNEEALREKLAFMSAELDHEREERNYFQLERDKVNTFWEITKKVKKTHLCLPVAPQYCCALTSIAVRRSWRIERQSCETRTVRWKSSRSVIRLRSRCTSRK